MSTRLMVEAHGVHKAFGATKVLRGVEGIGFARFSSADVVRHPLVARIVNAYDARDAADPGQVRG